MHEKQEPARPIEEADAGCLARFAAVAGLVVRLAVGHHLDTGGVGARSDAVIDRGEAGRVGVARLEADALVSSLEAEADVDSHKLEPVARLVALLDGEALRPGGRIGLAGNPLHAPLAVAVLVQEVGIALEDLQAVARGLVGALADAHTGAVHRAPLEAGVHANEADQVLAGSWLVVALGDLDALGLVGVLRLARLAAVALDPCAVVVDVVRGALQDLDTVVLAGVVGALAPADTLIGLNPANASDSALEANQILAGLGCGSGG